MSAHSARLNQMRLQAALIAGTVGKPRLGLVSSYDPDAYAVKVKLQPEDVETGWLPITTLMAGNGWGVYFGPSIGDQASVAFQEGDRETGWCTGFLPSDEDRPPRVESGEMHLVHSSGDYIKFTADGIQSKGTWIHDGPLLTTGDMTDISGSNSVTLQQLRDAYDAHKHTGVQTGGGTTGTTDHPT